MREYVLRLAMLAAIAAAGVTLSACSGYDVEFKGGVFDALGVNDIKGRQEPKMANRAGLVIPPSTASLPQPGSAPQRTAAAPGGEAFPVNPEDRKKQNTAEIVKRHEAFCAKARQRFETGMTDTIANSPWGACHQSVLRNFTGYDLSGKKAVGKQ